jgi:hypothetical protein
MTRLRRATALVLAGLAGPSAIWLLLRLLGVPSDSSSHGWGAELLFVVCCLVAAAATWAAVRYWPLVVFAVAASYTYLITGPLVSGVLLVAPGTYVASVVKESVARGLSGGVSLAWSLLVLPIAFPVLSVFAAWLCVVLMRADNARAI